MRRICVLLFWTPVLVLPQIGDNLSFIIENNPSTATHQERYQKKREFGSVGIACVLNGAIKFYQRYLSVRDMRVCQFDVSCSNFAIKAISEYGPFWGILMSNDRVLRCNPYVHKYYCRVLGKDLVVDRPMEDYYLLSYDIVKGVKRIKAQ